MDNYIIRKLLNENELKSIQNIIFDPNVVWENGLVTNMKADKIKKNLQLPYDYDDIIKIDEIIMNALDNDSKFVSFCCPKSSGNITVSKYDLGSFYDIHHDNFMNGDYSTTIFLNDPSDYDGGELCLYLNEEEKKVKLDAGYAITYTTGIPHKVNEVISGHRYAAVLWTKSRLKDAFMIELHNDLRNLQSILKKSEGYDSKSFESVLNDPNFVIESIISKIMRKTI